MTQPNAGGAAKPVWPGAFCGPEGAEGFYENGTKAKCIIATDGRGHWSRHPDEPAPAKKARVRKPKAAAAPVVLPYVEAVKLTEPDTAQHIYSVTETVTDAARVDCTCGQTCLVPFEGVGRGPAELIAHRIGKSHVADPAANPLAWNPNHASAKDIAHALAAEHELAMRQAAAKERLAATVDRLKKDPVAAEQMRKLVQQQQAGLFTPEDALARMIEIDRAAADRKAAAEKAADVAKRWRSPVDGGDPVAAGQADEVARRVRAGEVSPQQAAEDLRHIQEGVRERSQQEAERAAQAPPQTGPHSGHRQAVSSAVDEIADTAAQMRTDRDPVGAEQAARMGARVASGELLVGQVPDELKRLRRESRERLANQARPVSGQRSTKPVVDNRWGMTSASPGSVVFHPDGQVGQAIDDMGDDKYMDVDGEPLANVLGRIVTDEVGGRIRPDEEIRQLRAVHARLPEGSRAATSLGYALDELDTPTRPMPQLHDDTPEPLRVLTEKLVSNPLARRPHPNGRPTELDQLLPVIQDFHEGRISPRRMLRGVETIRNQRHELNEGKSTLDRDVTEACDELKRLIDAKDPSVHREMRDQTHMINDPTPYRRPR